MLLMFPKRTWDGFVAACEDGAALIADDKNLIIG
jgi:hypothetical protein